MGEENQDIWFWKFLELIFQMRKAALFQTFHFMTNGMVKRWAFVLFILIVLERASGVSPIQMANLAAIIANKATIIHHILLRELMKKIS